MYIYRAAGVFSQTAVVCYANLPLCFMKKTLILVLTMKHYTDIITIDHQIRFGRPCIRGMRISVSDILGWLASGMTETEIVKDYPELTIEDIKASLAYAADREHKIRIAS